MESASRDARRAPAGRISTAYVLAFLGLLLFLVLTLLVQMRITDGPDLTLLNAVRHNLASRGLFRLANVAAMLAAAGFSVVYAGIAILILWRAGVGAWSFAPALFLVSVPAELLMKLVVDQPPLPNRFGYQPDYPQGFEDSIGTYPSGHAIRASFFCVFLAVLLWRRGDTVGRLSAAVVVLLGLLLGFARVYLGVHWASDVIGGLLLGSSLALLVAPPVARRLRRRA